VRNLTLCKIAAFKWMEKALFVLYENHQCRSKRVWHNVSLWELINFLKENCLPLSHFKCEEHQLHATLFHSSEWKKHLFSSKKTINVRSRRVCHIVSLWKFN
jgi:hypothetical protein